MAQPQVRMWVIQGPSSPGIRCPRARPSLRMQYRRGLHRRSGLRHIVSSVSSLLMLFVLTDITVAAAASEELLQDAQPRDLSSCTDYNTSDSVVANPQWLFWDTLTGQPYLKLPLTDNWSRYTRGLSVETTWQRLLIQEPKVGDRQIQLDLSDFSFSTTNTGVVGVEWGLAADCRGNGLSSKFSINLQGTPFMYEPVHSMSIGFAATGGVTCDATGQLCTADCGGMCGFCGLGIAGSTKSATLKVVDQCVFDEGIQLWATTTTTVSTLTSSSTFSSSTFLGNTTTKTTTSISSSSSTSSSSSSNSSTSATNTFTTTNTHTLTTTSGTSQSNTSTSETSTQTTTTVVDGWQYYRFSPTKTADESVVGACQAHGISELKMMNCGSTLDLSFAVAYQPGKPSSSAALAIDGRWDTEWMDATRQPLVIRFRQRTFVDEYRFVTNKRCPPSDPVEWQLHGSHDGLYWVLLDESGLPDPPPTQISWRPVQTDGYIFANCTQTSTTTTSASSTTSSTWTSSSSLSITSSHTKTRTASLTVSTSTSTTSASTMSTTTSPEGDFVLLIKYGICSDHKMFPITDSVACESAARTLSLSHTSVRTTATENRPEGCYIVQGSKTGLWLSINPLNKGKGVETSEGNVVRLPVCSSKRPGDSAVGVATSSGDASSLRYRGALLASVVLLAML